MSDEDAYMALALCNAQGELSPIERGLHALNVEMGVREYARAVNRDPGQITRERHAAEVLTQVNSGGSSVPIEEIAKCAKQLNELHAAPRWLWRSLVSRLVAEGWTVEQARGAAQGCKQAEPRFCTQRGAGQNCHSQLPDSLQCSER
jgi:hypothetical protein